MTESEQLPSELFSQDMKNILKLQKKVCICQLCGKGFPCPSNLKQHMESHKETRPYKCKKCEKDYRNERNLAQHVKRSHIGLRPYYCMICDRTYDHKKHQLVHSQE